LQRNRRRVNGRSGRPSHDLAERPKRKLHGLAADAHIKDRRRLRRSGDEAVIDRRRAADPKVVLLDALPVRLDGGEVQIVARAARMTWIRPRKN
jgi:hypothetical protein